MTSERLLEMEDLCGGYKTAPVLRSITMHVDAGEVVALLGPNGAGKTTTLKTISGILPPTSGTLRVLGQPVHRGRPWLVARRGVAHVPEERGLFFQLTVRENLVLGVRKGSPDLDRVFTYFPVLKNLLRRRAGLLSGGEQQMLATGRAIVSGARLIMVDEMSLGLAPILVERLLPVLRQVAKDTNAGILLVEQHIELALSVADRGYVLNRGAIEKSGTADLLRRDRHLLEAEYLGSLAGS